LLTLYGITLSYKPQFGIKVTVHDIMHFKTVTYAKTSSAWGRKIASFVQR